MHENSLVLTLNCGFVVCKSSLDRFNQYPYTHFYIFMLRLCFAFRKNELAYDNVAAAVGTAELVK